MQTLWGRDTVFFVPVSILSVTKKHPSDGDLQWLLMRMSVFPSGLKIFLCLHFIQTIRRNAHEVKIAFTHLRHYRSFKNISEIFLYTSATKAGDMVKWQSDCLGCTSNHSLFPVPQNKTTQQSNNKKLCCTKQLKTNWRKPWGSWIEFIAWC